jgi:signal transduction histidine kinase
VLSKSRPAGDNRTERGVWTLWGAAFALLVALAATVHLLHLRVLTMLQETGETAIWIRNGYYTGVGLTGLVLLFIVYTAYRQVQVHRLYEVLRTEERELEDVRARLSEITTLFQLATAVNLELPLDTVLAIIVRRVVGALKAQQASIMLFDPDDETLVTRAYYGLEGEFALNGRRRLGEGIAGRVAASKEALLLDDTASDPDMTRHFKAHRNITSALSVPLRVDDRVVGVLNVNRISSPQPFTLAQRDVLRLFAEHVGTVIQRAENAERLEEHAHTLERANADLSEMNRMKDMFLSTASHELKTPLTSIIAYAELLNDHDERLGTEDRLEFLGRLRAEADRLMGLIEDILDLTRLETGKAELKRRSLPLNQLAQAAVETTRPMAQQAKVQIVENFSTKVGAVLVDEGKLRQAVVNLIVNAVKFSPEGSCVTVRTRNTEDGLRIEVADQGPGVAAEEVSKIFALFGQSLRKSTRQAGGLGIGLHLVKRVVEMHEGTVGVESRLGEGSLFWIQLPSHLGQELPASEAA